MFGGSRPAPSRVKKCGGTEGFSGFWGRGSQGNTGPTPTEHLTIFKRRRQREREARERERGWVSAAGMRTFFAALGLGLAAVPGIRACVVKCLGTCVLAAAVCLLSLVKCTHDSEIGYLWHHRRTAVTRMPHRGGIFRVLQWAARVV